MNSQNLNRPSMTFDQIDDYAEYEGITSEQATTQYLNERYFEMMANGTDEVQND